MVIIKWKTYLPEQRKSPRKVRKYISTQRHNWGLINYLLFTFVYSSHVWPLVLQGTLITSWTMLDNIENKIKSLSWQCFNYYIQFVPIFKR